MAAVALRKVNGSALEDKRFRNAGMSGMPGFIPLRNQE
jgi:hypothetical protein